MSKVCLFAPCYNEYNIIEWMDYHYKIGVDYIIIYDDQSDISVDETIKESNLFNSDKYIVLKDIVPQYLSGKKIDEKNANNQSIRSTYFFNELRKYIDKYEYILSIDIDEYLFTGSHNTIQDMIKYYEPFDHLYIHYKIFRGLKKNTKKTLINNFLLSGDFVFMGKSLAKTNKIFSQTSPHLFDPYDNVIYYPNDNYNFISKNTFNIYFNLSQNSGLNNLDIKLFYENIQNNGPYIAHYQIQSIETFLHRRLIDRTKLLKNSVCSVDNLKKKCEFFIGGSSNYDRLINNELWMLSNYDISDSIEYIYNQKNIANNHIINKYDNGDIRMETLEDISKIYWNTYPLSGDLNYDLYFKYNKNDNRSKIIKKNNFFIITNYKVMYSSINMLDSDKNIDINNINNYPIIFLYRNTYRKIISCFLNWCFYNSVEIGIMYLLKNNANFDYKLFFNLICDKKLILSFKMFINALEYINDDEHLRNQCDILKFLNIDNIHYFIDIDNNNDIEKFENLINDQLYSINSNKKEDINNLLLFLNDENNVYYKNIINNMYLNDYLFFQKYNISIY